MRVTFELMMRSPIALPESLPNAAIFARTFLTAVSISVRNWLLALCFVRGWPSGQDNG